MLPLQKDSSGLAVRSEPRKEEFAGERLAAQPDDGAAVSELPATVQPTDTQVGRYIVGGQLGSGGAASVYRAYDQIQDRWVALKMLSPGADAIVRDRFRQEARTVSGLRHPHIVQTLQVGDATSDGSAYIAMELVDGESMDRLLKRRGRLGVAISCSLLAPIARALAYAHQQDVVHRDVKPSNILLRPAILDASGSGQTKHLVASAVHEAEQILVDGLDIGERSAGSGPPEPLVAPLLSDFGIARALDMPELTNEGRTIGTPAYMAPEQCAASREITGRADIYSLGAVLFRCLVGRPPFNGTTTQILYAHVYASLSLPSDLLATLPPELVAVLRRSLSKEPADRYASASEMADDLTEVAVSILGQENGLADQTSTRTLVTLPLVGLPPGQPQSGDTVIIQGSDGKIETSTAPRLAQESNAQGSNAQESNAQGSNAQGSNAQGSNAQKSNAQKSNAQERAESSLDNGAKRSRARLTATVVGSVLFLVLVAVIGPAARNALLDSAPPATVASGLAVTVVPSSPPAVEQQAEAAIATVAPVAGAGAQAAQGTSEQNAEDPTVAISEEPLQACQYQTALAFDSVFSGNGAVGRELGCPKSVPTDLSYEIQLFQTGMALGRLDRQTVYLRYYSNDEWEQREHDWLAGMPWASEAQELQAPTEGLFQPIRGIGQVWAESLFVRQAMGWATSEPEEVSGVLQSFEGGLLIYNDITEDIYIFLKSQLRL